MDYSGLDPNDPYVQEAVQRGLIDPTTNQTTAPIDDTDKPTPVLTPEGFDTSDPYVQEAMKRGLIKSPLPQSAIGEFGQGVVRGLGEMGNTLNTALPALGEGLVNDADKALGGEGNVLDNTAMLKKFNENEQRIENLHPSKYKGISDIKSLSDLPGATAAFLGEQIPSLGLGIATGGVGEITAANAAVGKLADSAIQDSIIKLASDGGEGITKEAADDFIKKSATMGALAGTGAGFASTEIPDTYAQLANSGQDKPVTAIAVGALKSAIGIMPEFQIVKNVFGPAGEDSVAKGLLSKVGIDAPTKLDKAVTDFAKIGGIAGGTGVINQGIDILTQQFLNGQPGLTDPQSIHAMIDAGVKGAIGGGVIGAALSPFNIHGATNKQEDSETGGVPESDFTKQLKASLQAQGLSNIDLGQPSQPNNQQQPSSPIAGMDPQQQQRSAKSQLLSSSALTPKPEQVNPLDNAIIVPSYLPKTLMDQANGIGLNRESFNNLSPSEVKSINDTKSSIDSGYTGETQSTSSAPVDIAALNDRLNRIHEGNRTDTNFLPGDGEIVQGVPYNEDATPINKARTLEVNNANSLEQAANAEPGQSTNAPVLPATQTFKLPKSLGSPKPRYSGVKIDFPSDVEKAIYTVGNRAGKLSDKDEHFVNWLHATVGLNDKQIQQHYKDIKDSLQDQHSNRSDEDIENGKALKAPKVALQGNLGLLRKGRMSLPAHGNLQDDYIVPKAIANNLNGLHLTDAAREQYKPLIDMANRIVRETLGEGHSPKLFAKLEEGLTKDPVLGAQFAHTIALAINEHSTPGQVGETAYHEVYHMLEEHGLVPEHIVRMMDKNTGMLKKYMDADDHLSQYDFNNLMNTPGMRKELRANAFGKLAMELRQNKQALDDVPGPFKGTFRKGVNLIRRLSNAVRGMGFNTPEDFVKSVMEGKNANDLIGQAMDLNSQARFQRAAKQRQDNDHEVLLSADPLDRINQCLKAANDKSLRDGRITLWGRYVSSMKHLGADNHWIANIFTGFQRRLDDQHTFLKDYNNLMPNYNKMEKAQRYEVHELSDYNRTTNQKAKFLPDGSLAFDLNGQTITRDPEFAQCYKELQSAYGKELSDHMDTLKRAIAREFGDDLPMGANFTMKDIYSLSKQLDPEKQEGKINKLNKVMELMANYHKAQLKDYAPRMRFGPWGVTVRNKDTGEQEALYTVENGNFNKLYNKHQMELMHEDIKNKYSDLSKYDIITDKGALTNLDDLKDIHPFRMTYNNINKNLDPKLMNLELLSSLLANKDVNFDAIKDVRDGLMTDVASRGFNKHFADSKNVHGYSRDWDRVNSAFLTGASHFFAGMDHHAELTKMQEVLNTNQLKDDRQAGAAKDYINYLTTPQQEWQTIRTMNAMWVMGGSLGTAITELGTIPTTILGSLTQYGNNPIKNMQLLGKWTRIGMESITRQGMDSFKQSGQFSPVFTEPKVWDRLIKNGHASEEQRQYNVLAEQIGRLRENNVAENTGSLPFETRSKTGSIKAQLSKMSGLLATPVSMMEQVARFACANATFELFDKDPEALARAQRVLKNDAVFQSTLARNTDRSLKANLTNFALDEGHSVAGKLGRSPYQRGAGGAFFFPFMTYPQQAFELMGRMLMSRGTEGRAAFMTTLASFAIIGGIMSLPGADLIDELYKKLSATFTGHEVDLEDMMRNKISDWTGSPRAAKFFTHGAGRALGGIDFGPKIGIPAPGEDMAMTLLGGKMPDQFGVEGTIMKGMASAWDNYNNGAPAATVMSSLLPTGVSNIVKAIGYTQNGVMNGAANKQLVEPQDVSAQTVLARALGLNSDQVNSARETMNQSYFNDHQYDTAFDRYKNQLENLQTQEFRAQNKGDWDAVKDLQNQRQSVIMDYMDFCKSHNIPADAQSMNSAVKRNVQQRMAGTVMMKQINKRERPGLSHEEWVYQQNQ